MKFLLDTNVVSELAKPHPDSRVEAWLSNAVAADLYISCVTLAEICKGITLLPAGKRQRECQGWLDETLRPWFADRVLSIDSTVAERTGIMVAVAQLKGRTMSLADALIAATALVHGLTVVTRNVKDFDHLTGFPLFNPWT
jgi:toxin FitB